MYAQHTVKIFRSQNVDIVVGSVRLINHVARLSVHNFHDITQDFSSFVRSKSKEIEENGKTV